ncbi:MAG: MBL fold metallo-hydrolase [Bacteroidetes bacterium RIFOXYA12_FULL_35_11]|nr:MAG: MBL fold metallo-hydrolase [Bacteroidetes bacterium GWF2_35_48]OFY76424.1 MAG: MBL fold metallo-hydrolase [Bacteroidetes bacterium RIFOXYA12_FULL_35_11]HBX52420.1 MBL fold metallo-hydrolase [Bacteroidales bacterium]
MKALQIKENVYWVGALDWELRNFHGYKTQRGSSYNAYLIIDEKITLIDSVKHYLTDDMLKRIRTIVDPSKIDYVICNHSEMDHSGAIPEVMKLAPNATVIASPKGIESLKAHYKQDWNFKTVQSGDTFSTGKYSFSFLLTPMVHWPDNMLTYMPDKKILFSNDAFGQHLASSEMFDDVYPLDIIMEEARKYYANIVMPYNSQVRKALEESKNLDIDIIAPSHGVIWRKHLDKIIEEYKKWSSNQTDKKALIVYDTMWGSTEKMAKAIYEVFEEKGFRVYIFNLQHNHISDIMEELINAEYICVGSPTLNKNIMPTVAGFLTYMTGLSPKNRKAIAFGSYGWAAQNIKQIEAYFAEADFQVIDSYKINYIPGEEQLETIKATLSEKIK